MKDRMESVLQKLSLKQGDILLIQGWPASTLLSALRDAGKLLGLDAFKIPVILLGDATLESVDEETMKRAGWVRERE